MPKWKFPASLKEPYHTVDREVSPAMWRWILFWNTVSYLSLLVVTLWVFSGKPLRWPEPVMSVPLTGFQLVLGLFGSLLWGLWYWHFVVRYDRWEQKIQIKAISFVFAILLAFGLSWLHPAYFFLLFNLFGVAFGVLPALYSVPVIVLMGVMMLLRLILPIGLSWSSLNEVVWIVFYVLGAIVLGLWLRASVNQAAEQQRVVDELEFTQGELARQQRESGMLAERQRLAGAIHDTLAQDLTSIVMHLEAAEQALQQDPDLAHTHLVTARSAAREGLAEARRFVWALQPQVTEREPLPDALQRIMQSWQEETGIQTRFGVEGELLPLMPPVEVTILRAAQEALANINKHANAEQVTMTLTFMTDEVWLDVQDDGIGFDTLRLSSPDMLRSGGYGLYSLRERAREMGGQLVVESEPGQGTTLVLQLPVFLSEPDLNILPTE